MLILSLLPLPPIAVSGIIGRPAETMPKRHRKLSIGAAGESGLCFMLGRRLYSEDAAQYVRSAVSDHPRPETSAPEREQPIHCAEDSNLDARFRPW